MTASHFTTRRAMPADADAISALIHDLASHFLADPERPEDAAAFFETVTPAGVEALLQDPRYRYHVAFQADVLVGVVGIRDGTHLYHLFVAESRHGHGLGKRLWHLAKDDATSRGHDGPFTVNASLSAVPVYERFGFVPKDTVQTKDGLAFLPMTLRD